MSNPLWGLFRIQYQAVTEPLVLPPAVVVPPLSWEPEYVDQPRRRAPLPVAILTAFFFAPVAPENKIPMDWRGTQPDFAGRGVSQQPVENLTSYAYVPTASRWGLDALPWLPVYPDFPGRGPLPMRSDAYTTFLSFDPFPRPPVPFPDLAWSPTYPDMVRGRAPLPVPPFLSFSVDPIPTPVPDLSWAPIYPGPVRTLPRILTAAQQALFFDPFPATPYEPTVDWIPKYPDFPGRTVRPLPTTGLSWFAHVGLTAYPTFTAYATPFFYDADAWPPDAEFFLEVYARSTTGRIYAGIAKESDLVPIAASLVDTVSASFVRLRSSGFTLASGTYRIVFGKIAGDAGEALSGRIGNVS